MEITRFIADLLRRNDEVIVPGLGTFFKERVDGYYNPLNETFIPPREKLSFKKDFTENPQLTDYISKQKNISDSSASYFLEKLITDLKEQLETSQYFDFLPLGIFKKVQNEYRFEYTDELTLEDAFYGLKPVTEQKGNPAPILSRNTGEHKPSEKETLTSREISNEGYNPKLNESVVSNPEADRNIDRTNNSLLHKIILREPEIEIEGPEETGAFKLIRKIALVLAFAGILGSTICYFFYPKAFKLLFEPEIVLDKLINEEKAAPLPLPKSLVDSMSTADSIMNALQSEGLEVETSDTAQISDNVQKLKDTTHIIKQSKTLNDTTQPTFEIIAASLNRPSDAQKIVSNFKSMGIEAIIIYAPKKRKNGILISIGTLNSMAAAEKELIRVKKNIEKDAYIYINQNQDNKE